MASREQIVRSHDFIRRAYAPRVVSADFDTLVVWHDLLADIPDDQVEAAVFELCRSAQHPPVPAEIVTKAREMFPAKVAAHRDFEPDETFERGGDPAKVRGLLDAARERLSRQAAS